MRRRFLQFLCLALSIPMLVGCGNVDAPPAEANVAPPTTSSADDTAKAHAPTETTNERLDANTVLSGAIASGKDQQKNVLVHIGAPW